MACHKVLGSRMPRNGAAPQLPVAAVSAAGSGPTRWNALLRSLEVRAAKKAVTRRKQAGRNPSYKPLKPCCLREKSPWTPMVTFKQNSLSTAGL